jgi:hypothetical protein
MTTNTMAKQVITTLPVMICWRCWNPCLTTITESALDLGRVKESWLACLVAGLAESRTGWIGFRPRVSREGRPEEPVEETGIILFAADWIESKFVLADGSEPARERLETRAKVKKTLRMKCFKTLQAV